MVKLPAFADCRVLVVGDLIIDEFIHGTCERISPEAPVPVLHSSGVGDELRAGGAANVAVNIAALGARVSILGIVGDDANGEWLGSALRELGIDCSFCVNAGVPTIRKTRIMSRNQQLLRLDREQGYQAANTDLVARFEQLLPTCDLVVLSDYRKGTLVDARALLALAVQHTKRALVDPKTSFEHYHGAWLLTPNLAELRHACGRALREQEDIVSTARALMTEHGIENMLITRSEQGMSLVRADAELHLGTRAREVYDVTGAGDTVIATLASALAANPEDLNGAVKLANMAAGIVVGKVGTASVSWAELELALSKAHADSAVVDSATLSLMLHSARQRGERIVFTNGCFDILHAGHVHYLEQARALGDRLVVAVNSDASVRRLKGDDRPINALAQRMAVLAALRAVDWVVAFDADTPEELLRELRPEVLVKGGDYSGVEAVVGYRIVQAYGGEVRTLGVIDQLSTSEIVQRIRAS